MSNPQHQIERVSQASATYKLVDAVEVDLKEGELVVNLLLEVLLIHDDTLDVLAPL
jgi:hypothetical protein